MSNFTKRTLSRLLVGLFLFVVLVVPAAGRSFDYWWPWIYARCVTNSLGTNAWTWVVANSNYINYMYGQTNYWNGAAGWVEAHSNHVQYMEGRTNDWNAAANLQIGIWRMSHSKEISVLPYILTTKAGFWQMDTNAEIILSGDYWTDSFWETNGAGEVVTRDVP